MAAGTLPYTPAAAHPLPKRPFFSIEYPGYIERTSESSIQRAIHTLGGAERLDASLRSGSVSGSSQRKETSSSASSIPVELHLRPESFYAHPVPGETVATSNLVLKITTRRKRKRDDGMDVDERQPDSNKVQNQIQSQYTAEVLGSIRKTVRFRSEHKP